MVVRAVHRLQVVGFLHYLFALPFPLLGNNHRRVHGVLVIGQMAGRVVEILPGNVRGGDAHVAVLELLFPGELLELIADGGAVRQPQGQAGAYLRVDGVDVELRPELLMVALQALLVALHPVLEGLLVLVRPGVDASHHLVAFVTTPIRASHRAQLEAPLRDLAGLVQMRSFAHVNEGAVGVEAQGLEPVLFRQLAAVLGLIGFTHFLQARQRVLDGEILSLEDLILLDDVLHTALDFGKIFRRDRLGQDEVVVEAIIDRWPEAPRAARTNVENGLRHHVSERMAETIERVLVALVAELVGQINHGTAA